MSDRAPVLGTRGARVARTATVRAKTACDLVALDKTSLDRILRDHPQFADSVLRVASERYNLNLPAHQQLAAPARPREA